MPLSALNTDERLSLRQRIEAIPGVESAFLDVEAGTICVVREGPYDRRAVHEATEAVLAEWSLSGAAGLRLEVLARPDPGVRRRVRFEDVTCELDAGGCSSVRVRLEWGGRQVEGFVTAPAAGWPLELKATAEATVAALNAVTTEPLEVRVMGVKEVRAFDTDLMAVSLWRAAASPQRFVGTVQVGGQPHRAVAVAVLNALNRVLGNTLFVHD